MLHVDTTLIVGIFIKTCRIWEQSTVSHPQNFCRFSLRVNSNCHWMFWFGPYISAKWKLQDDTFLMICNCIGILLCWHANDVMFWGFHSHFGTQKNHATTTKANKKYGAPKWESLQETAYLHIVLITQYTFGLNFMRASMHRFWEPDGGRGLHPPLPRFVRSEVMFVFQEICRSDWSAKFINCHNLPVMLKIAGKPVSTGIISFGLA